MQAIETSEAPAWARMAETLAGVGYWRLDIATKRIQWSENMFRIFGFEQGVAPSLEQAMARVHPDDRFIADDNLKRDLNGEARTAPTAVRLTWPSGEIRHIEGRTTSLTDAGGQVVAVVGAILDVTERKRAEQELQRAKNAAEQAASDKSTFAANVTHELRTPLTSIIGYANLLAQGGPDAARRLNLLVNSSRTLLSIVNNVLDYSRIEEGRAAINPVACSPRELGQECIDLFGALAQERGLSLRYIPSPDLPAWVSIDPDAVRQVLVNLIGNAIKFTERGWVSLSVAYQDSCLTFAVQDSGGGLDPSEFERVFERYERSRFRENRAGGAGLGLAISRGLTNAMGGSITASNQAGGACFRCSIPAPVADAGASSTAVVSLSGVKVLITDDHASIREISKCLLQAAGADVSEASDGLSAIAMASSEKFDVIFVDLNMPGISGEEVAKYLRSLGVNREATIIAFTASGSVTLADVKAKGFDDLFAKPIDPARMLTLAWTAARRREAA
jgi:PAS domain S-box-containing protein